MRKFLIATLAWLLLITPVNAWTYGEGSQAFGVNLSGAEFAPWTGQVFPTTAAWDAMQSNGVRTVRLPFAWESLQPTLNGALDTTYLNSIKTALSRAASRNIKVIADLHNFGGYCDQSHWVSSGCGYAGNAGVAATGVTFLGAAGGPTTANFVDVWTKIATALGGLPGLGGFNLMNEPTDLLIGRTNLLFAPNGFANSVSIAPWVAGGSTITVQATGTNPLGAAYGPAWTLNSGAGFGNVSQNVTLTAVQYTVSCYAKVASGSATLLYLINSGPSQVFGTGAITTSWARITPFSFTGLAGVNNIAIAEGAGASNVNIQLANCQLELGASATTYVPNPLLVYYQAAINAIAIVAGSTPIYIDGLSGSTPYQWGWTNWELAQLTGGPLLFSAHAYFCTTQAQGGGGTTCTLNFSQYTGLTVNSGVDFATPFVNWVIATGVTGYIGEFGTSSACCIASPADANANWLTLQTNFLTYLVANNIHGDYFAWFDPVLDPTSVFNLSNGDARFPAMMAIGKGH